MIVRRLSVEMDFCEYALQKACGMMGTYPANVICYIGQDHAAEAQLLRDKYRCDTVLLPTEMLAQPLAWAIKDPNSDQIVWSPGA